MNFKETGFRPFYHHVCALELNDKLRELLKDCPEIDKSSHAVVYGYIDPENGLTLEVLGAGKQAPKYFYFKEPYENTRVFIRISEVAEGTGRASIPPPPRPTRFQPHRQSRLPERRGL